MTRPIGIYVHHHGAGHWQRACRIATALRRPVTLLGTFNERDTKEARVPLVDLPDDRIVGFDGDDGEAERPEALHYAPLNHPGIRERMARIAAWIAKADPVLVIVDVSVEVTLLCRLLSVPTVVVRLAGSRTDAPHLGAFRAATRLIVPYPAALDAADVPEWVRAKSFFSGFLGSSPVTKGAEDGRIVVVFGQGGRGGCIRDLAAASRAIPDRTWHVLGPVEGTDDGTPLPSNLHLHGWVEDVDAHLSQASLVVGGAGDGVVAAVVAASKRFICLPEPRPYGEQTTKADALASLGAAIIHHGWPSAAAWPDLVRQGMALDASRIASLADPDALVRTIAEVETMAHEIQDGADPALETKPASECPLRRQPGRRDLVRGRRAQD
ncbi:glycosyltransferase [Methylobacterium sp. C25]|uniref:glycosyltransferase n=1 Tax=Methylobacterium sp. C25 TaxID=2721622 RepID=UPI001F168B50|nr:glycosyltransferase [Methylobacterium sp. C25]MCE4226628.1 glycosyltransferase [Methylobacterium sp. C25]